MKRPDTFVIYLHSLDARDVEYRVTDDGRHVLQITSDLTLYIRPGEDDVAAVAAGLRKLAEAASEMAAALSSGEDPADTPEETS